MLILVLLALALAGSPAITAHGQTSNNQDEVISLIYYYAEQYDVDAGFMLRVARCESNFNPWAVGDHGNSTGVYQWHIRGLWYSTPYGRQGMPRPYGNPDPDVEMAAWAFSRGLAYHWTCARR